MDSDGAPFWFVLGQSASTGWEARADGATLGERQTVDGFANGWLVTPDGAGTVTIDLDWRPQRTVRWGLLVSAVAALVVVGVLVVGRRRIPTSHPALAARPRLMSARDTAPLGPLRSALVAVASVLLGVVVAPVGIALLAGAAALVAGLARWGRWAIVVVAPVALALSRLVEQPALAWLAVLLLAGDLLVGALRRVSPVGVTVSAISGTDACTPPLQLAADLDEPVGAARHQRLGLDAVPPQEHLVAGDRPIVGLGGVGTMAEGHRGGRERWELGSGQRRTGPPRARHRRAPRSPPGSPSRRVTVETPAPSGGTSNLSSSVGPRSTLTGRRSTCRGSGSSRGPRFALGTDATWR